MSQDLHTESLVACPCDYRLKAMGRNDASLSDTVMTIVRKHAPDTPMDNLELKHSKKSRFISVNVTFYATDIAQIHAIYRELNAHDAILMTL